MTSVFKFLSTVHTVFGIASFKDDAQRDILIRQLIDDFWNAVMEEKIETANEFRQEIINKGLAEKFFADSCAGVSH